MNSTPYHLANSISSSIVDSINDYVHYDLSKYINHFTGVHSYNDLMSKTVHYYNQHNMTLNNFIHPSTTPHYNNNTSHGASYPTHFLMNSNLNEHTISTLTPHHHAPNQTPSSKHVFMTPSPFSPPNHHEHSDGTLLLAPQAVIRHSNIQSTHALLPTTSSPSHISSPNPIIQSNINPYIIINAGERAIVYNFTQQQPQHSETLEGTPHLFQQSPHFSLLAPPIIPHPEQRIPVIKSTFGLSTLFQNYFFLTQFFSNCEQSSGNNGNSHNHTASLLSECLPYKYINNNILLKPTRLKISFWSYLQQFLSPFVIQQLIIIFQHIFIKNKSFRYQLLKESPTLNNSHHSHHNQYNSYHSSTPQTKKITCRFTISDVIKYIVIQPPHITSHASNPRNYSRHSNQQHNFPQHPQSYLSSPILSNNKYYHPYYYLDYAINPANSRITMDSKIPNDLKNNHHYIPYNTNTCAEFYRYYNKYCLDQYQFRYIYGEPNQTTSNAYYDDNYENELDQQPPQPTPPPDPKHYYSPRMISHTQVGPIINTYIDINPACLCRQSYRDNDPSMNKTKPSKICAVSAVMRDHLIEIYLHIHPSPTQGNIHSPSLTTPLFATFIPTPVGAKTILVRFNTHNNHHTQHQSNSLCDVIIAGNSGLRLYSLMYLPSTYDEFINSPVYRKLFLQNKSHMMYIADMLFSTQDNTSGISNVGLREISDGPKKYHSFANQSHHQFFRFTLLPIQIAHCLQRIGFNTIAFNSEKNKPAQLSGILPKKPTRINDNDVSYILSGVTMEGLCLILNVSTFYNTFFQQINPNLSKTSKTSQSAPLTNNIAPVRLKLLFNHKSNSHYKNIVQYCFDALPNPLIQVSQRHNRTQMAEKFQLSCATKTTTPVDPKNVTNTTNITNKAKNPTNNTYTTTAINDESINTTTTDNVDSINITTYNRPDSIITTTAVTSNTTSETPSLPAMLPDLCSSKLSVLPEINDLDNQLPALSSTDNTTPVKVSNTQGTQKKTEKSSHKYQSTLSNIPSDPIPLKDMVVCSTMDDYITDFEQLRYYYNYHQSCVLREKNDASKDMTQNNPTEQNNPNNIKKKAVSRVKKKKVKEKKEKTIHEQPFQLLNLVEDDDNNNHRLHYDFLLFSTSSSSSSWYTTDASEHTSVDDERIQAKLAPFGMGNPTQHNRALHDKKQYGVDIYLRHNDNNHDIPMFNKYINNQSNDSAHRILNISQVNNFDEWSFDLNYFILPQDKIQGPINPSSSTASFNEPYSGGYPKFYHYNNDVIEMSSESESSLDIQYFLPTSSESSSSSLQSHNIDAETIPNSTKLSLTPRSDPSMAPSCPSLFSSTSSSNNGSRNYDIKKPSTPMKRLQNVNIDDNTPISQRKLPKVLLNIDPLQHQHDDLEAQDFSFDGETASTYTSVPSFYLSSHHTSNTSASFSLPSDQHDGTFVKQPRRRRSIYHTNRPSFKYNPDNPIANKLTVPHRFTASQKRRQALQLTGKSLYLADFPTHSGTSSILHHNPQYMEKVISKYTWVKVQQQLCQNEDLLSLKVNYSTLINNYEQHRQRYLQRQAYQNKLSNKTGESMLEPFAMKAPKKHPLLLHDEYKFNKILKMSEKLNPAEESQQNIKCVTNDISKPLSPTMIPKNQNNTPQNDNDNINYTPAVKNKVKFGHIQQHVFENNDDVRTPISTSTLVKPPTSAQLHTPSSPGTTLTSPPSVSSRQRQSKSTTFFLKNLQRRLYLKYEAERQDILNKHLSQTYFKQANNKNTNQEPHDIMERLNFYDQLILSERSNIFNTENSNGNVTNIRVNTQISPNKYHKTKRTKYSFNDIAYITNHPYKTQLIQNTYSISHLIHYASQDNVLYRNTYNAPTTHPKDPYNILNNTPILMTQLNASDTEYFQNTTFSTTNLKPSPNNNIPNSLDNPTTLLPESNEETTNTPTAHPNLTIADHIKHNDHYNYPMYSQCYYSLIDNPNYNDPELHIKQPKYIISCTLMLYYHNGNTALLSTLNNINYNSKVNYFNINKLAASRNCHNSPKISQNTIDESLVDSYLFNNSLPLFYQDVLTGTTLQTTYNHYNYKANTSGNTNTLTNLSTNHIFQFSQYFFYHYYQKFVKKNQDSLNMTINPNIPLRMNNNQNHKDYSTPLFKLFPVILYPKRYNYAPYYYQQISTPQYNDTRTQHKTSHLFSNKSHPFFNKYELYLAPTLSIPPDMTVSINKNSIQNNSQQISEAIPSKNAQLVYYNFSQNTEFQPLNVSTNIYFLIEPTLLPILSLYDSVIQMKQFDQQYDTNYLHHSAPTLQAIPPRRFHTPLHPSYQPYMTYFMMNYFNIYSPKMKSVHQSAGPGGLLNPNMNSISKKSTHASDIAPPSYFNENLPSTTNNDSNIMNNNNCVNNFHNTLQYPMNSHCITLYIPCYNVFCCVVYKVQFISNVFTTLQPTKEHQIRHSPITTHENNHHLFKKYDHYLLTGHLHDGPSHLATHDHFLDRHHNNGNSYIIPNVYYAPYLYCFVPHRNPKYLNIQTTYHNPPSYIMDEKTPNNSAINILESFREQIKALPKPFSSTGLSLSPYGPSFAPFASTLSSLRHRKHIHDNYDLKTTHVFTTAPCDTSLMNLNAVDNATVSYFDPYDRSKDHINLSISNTTSDMTTAKNNNNNTSSAPKTLPSTMQNKSTLSTTSTAYRHTHSFNNYIETLSEVSLLPYIYNQFSSTQYGQQSNIFSVLNNKNQIIVGMTYIIQDSNNIDDKTSAKGDKRYKKNNISIIILLNSGRILSIPLYI